MSVSSSSGAKHFEANQHVLSFLIDVNPQSGHSNIFLSAYKPISTNVYVHLQSFIFSDLILINL